MFIIVQIVVGIRQGLTPYVHCVCVWRKITRIQLALIVSEAVRLGLIHPARFQSEIVGRDIRPNSRMNSSDRGTYEQNVMRSLIIK